MNDAATPSPTAQLAHFAVGVGTDAVPREVIETIRGCLLDFVGVSAYAARGIPDSTQLAAALDAMEAQPGEHVVVGAPRTRSQLQAAFLNGAHAHTLDFDDTNQPGLLHPGAPVIPAALAAAERNGSSGEDLLAAIAVGYEVACRVGRALGTETYQRGFHPTAIAGIFGAAAAAARLQGVTPAVLNNTFGLCGSRASGSMQFLANGAWNKRMHPGFAAHDALWCLMLAEAGAVGATAALEGQYGVLASYAPASRPEDLARGLETDWICSQTAIKPYPSCRFTHAAIDAALMLRGDPAAAGSASLRVRLNPAAFAVVAQSAGSQKQRPRTIVEAQFSVFFQLAVAWQYGAPTWESYQRIGDPAIEAMALRITAEPAADLLLSAAEVFVRDTPLHARVDYPLGEPQRPLSWTDIDRKFRSLAVLAYSDDRAAAISEAIRTLDKNGTMAKLAVLLRGETQ